MTTKKKTEVKSDPTTPFQVVEVQGKEYKMCFDFESLAAAEEVLLRQGKDVNLLACLPVMNLSNTRTLFAASLMHYQPDLSFEDSKKFLTHANYLRVVTAMIDSWKESTPEPEEDTKDPR